MKRLVIFQSGITQSSSAGKNTSSLIAGRFENVVFRHRTWPARLKQYNGATGRPSAFFTPIDGGAPEHEVSGPQEQECSREWVLVYPASLPAIFLLQDQRATEGLFMNRYGRPPRIEGTYPNLRCHWPAPVPMTPKAILL